MKVTFKVFKGEVIAMLDHIKGAYATVCYAHDGQHCELEHRMIVRATNATREEYAPLLAELRSVYRHTDFDITNRK